MERRQLLVLAGVALVPFSLLAVWAKYAAPAPWEPGLVAALALGPDAWGDLVRAISTLGSLVVWAVIVAGAAVIVGALRGLVAAALVALSYAADLAAFGVKLLVGRDRPETAATAHFFGPDNFSFPSGHVVRAVALVAVVLWLVAPAPWRLRLAIIGAFGAWLVMGYARVSLGVHWPTDTIGGALLGVGWFAVTTALLHPRVLKLPPALP